MEDQVQPTGEFSGGAADPATSVHEQPNAEAQSPEMVPVSALQAERRERQQLQEQMRVLSDHVSLMQANQVQPQTQDELSGMTDDDVLTVGEAKKYMSQMQNSYQTSIDEIKVQQKYRDYDQVVKDHLPDVVKSNPALKTTLQNDPNRYELAYFLAKNSDSYRSKNAQVKKSADAERIVHNGNQPQSLSAMGSNAPTKSPSMYNGMSDSDFMQMANKNRGYT